MKKSLIALAVAGAFAAPAFAATSNVDVGGTMDFSLDYLDADTATQGGNWNVSSNASNIYFKGSEDLGGGMKAFWQVQTYFSAGGTGNTDTSFGSNADGVSSGNTFVGVEGGFGKVLLGKHEAPVKLLSRKVDLFGNQIGDSRNLVTTAKPAGAASAVGFDTRPNNVIAYGTPAMGGFSALVAYVTNAASGAAADNVADAWSVNGTYENGPLFVGLGYETHNLSDQGALGDENIWRLAGSYSFGDFKVVALYQKEDNLTVGANTNADRTVWGLGGAYKMGPMSLKAQYYNADDTANVSNTGADMWALGLDYSLSKRTTVKFAYATTDNDSGAKYSAFGGGHGDQPTIANNGNPNGFSVGVTHKF